MLFTWRRGAAAIGVLLVSGGVAAASGQPETRRDSHHRQGLALIPAHAGPAANAARTGASSRWNEPPRNASEFSAVSPAVRKAMRRARRTRGGRRAHAAQIITCVAYASTTRGNLRYVAHGSATCDGTVDMLSAMACIDGWTASGGGYWTRIGCSNWKTRAPASQITADGYGRDCVNNKVYRAAAVVSGFHNGVSESAVDYAPSHPCGHY